MEAYNFECLINIDFNFAKTPINSGLGLFLFCIYSAKALFYSAIYSAFIILVPTVVSFWNLYFGFLRYVLSL